MSLWDLCRWKGIHKGRGREGVCRRHKGSSSSKVKCKGRGKRRARDRWGRGRGMWGWKMRWAMTRGSQSMFTSHGGVRASVAVSGQYGGRNAANVAVGLTEPQVFRGWNRHRVYWEMLGPAMDSPLKRLLRLLHGHSQFPTWS